MIFLSYVTANSQSIAFNYAKKTGGSAYDYGNAIAVDGTGNVYTTGVFQGTADFDPGTGTQNLVSAGGGDIFISKLDADGNYAWAIALGGSLDERGMAVTTDAAGNVYVSGYFAGTVDFDPSFLGINLLVTLGDPDIFVCKFDGNGNFVWARSMGGTGYDYPFSIAVGSNGNVYTAGKFQGTADFDPGLSANSLTSNSGSEDVFVSCLSSSGSFVWARRVGGSLNDNATSLTLNSGDDLFLTGYFQGTTDFDPGAGTANLVSAGGRDAFVLKLNNSGNYVLAKQLGGTLDDEGSNIALDVDGNLYVTGSYQGTGDFDPTAATYTMSSNGGTDGFVTKLTPSGSLTWAGSFGGTLNDKINDIAINASTAICITGYFQGTADLDPGTGLSNFTSAGGLDLFIATLSTDGLLRLARNMGGTLDDEATSIQLDNSGNIYTTGYFQSTVDFNPEAAVFNISSSGSYDMFVNKLNYTINTLPIELLVFSAIPVEEQVNLSWSTASEKNNKCFSVERSVNGVDWEMMTVMNGAGNSNMLRNYNCVDPSPYGEISYYRLKQTDFNGDYSYSPIVAVELKKEISLKLYPNPAVSYIQIISDSKTTHESTVDFYNTAGHLVKQVKGATNSLLIDVMDLEPGNYFAVIDSGAKVSRIQFVKN